MGYPEDEGVSEVVGFICILALIAVVLSIWSAGVPAGVLHREQNRAAAAAVQVSDLKLAMDMQWITGTAGTSRTVMVDSGTLCIGNSDVVVRITTNESVTDYVPLRISYASGFLYAENVLLSIDAGAVVLETGGFRSMILPPSVDEPRRQLTLPVLAAPAAEISATDPVAVTFWVEQIREQHFTNATLAVSGDSLLQKPFEQAFDCTEQYNLTVREVHYSVAVS